MNATNKTIEGIINRIRVFAIRHDMSAEDLEDTFKRGIDASRSLSEPPIWLLLSDLEKFNRAEGGVNDDPDKCPLPGKVVDYALEVLNGIPNWTRRDMDTKDHVKLIWQAIEYQRMVLRGDYETASQF